MPIPPRDAFLSALQNPSAQTVAFSDKLLNLIYDYCVNEEKAVNATQLMTASAAVLGELALRAGIPSIDEFDPCERVQSPPSIERFLRAASDQLVVSFGRERALANDVPSFDDAKASVQAMDVANEIEVPADVIEAASFVADLRDDLSFIALSSDLDPWEMAAAACHAFVKHAHVAAQELGVPTTFDLALRTSFEMARRAPLWLEEEEGLTFSRRVFAASDELEHFVFEKALTAFPIGLSASTLLSIAASAAGELACQAGNEDLPHGVPLTRSSRTDSFLDQAHSLLLGHYTALGGKAEDLPSFQEMMDTRDAAYRNNQAITPDMPDGLAPSALSLPLMHLLRDDVCDVIERYDLSPWQTASAAMLAVSNLLQSTKDSLQPSLGFSLAMTEIFSHSVIVPMDLDSLYLRVPQEAKLSIDHLKLRLYRMESTLH